MKTTWLLASLVLAGSVLAQTTSSLMDIPLKDINGKATSLKAYKGQVMLVVNVASQCGLTPQYKALETLYQ
jgi:glutathione peroxidase